jgi:plasmid stabilization system protein ParE
MGAQYTVKLSTRAQKDLESIFDYIQKDSPANAKGFIGRLLDSIETLDHMPYRYREPRRGRRRSRRIRRMPVGNYLITYKIDEAAALVHVLTNPSWCEATVDAGEPFRRFLDTFNRLTLELKG